MSLSVLIYIKYYVNDKFMPFWVVICHVNKSFTLPVYPIFYTVLYLRVFSCSLMPGWLFVTPCPSGSSVQGIFQARILEWVAICFSRGSPWPRDQTQVSYIAGGFSTIWATSCCCCCYIALAVSNSVWLHRRQPTRGIPHLRVAISNMGKHTS